MNQAMDDIYFEEDGVVSLWVGQVLVAQGSNFLKEQYGIPYYDPDNQECVIAEQVTPIAELFSQLSYCDSFQAAAVTAATRIGITSALWVMAQYDYAFDPEALELKALPKEPRFIGKFRWSE